MEVLVGTASGLVDAVSGQVVAFHGRDVGAVSGDWVVLDGHESSTRSGRCGPSIGEYQVHCIDGAHVGDPLVGTVEAHVFRLGTTPMLVESFEHAEGRDQWYTPWGGPPDVRSIASTPSGCVLVNVHVGGILRSTDQGKSWEPTIDLHHDVHQVIAPHDDWVLAACAHGLAISGDDGLNWALHAENMHATYSRAVAVSGEMVLLSASTGPGGSHAAIYRRRLGGDGGFERCRTGLPEWLEGNVDTGWMAGSPDGRAAFATRSGDVYLSADEGLTWERLASGLPAVRAVTLS